MYTFVYQADSARFVTLAMVVLADLRERFGETRLACWRSAADGLDTAVQAVAELRVG